MLYYLNIILNSIIDYYKMDTIKFLVNYNEETKEIECVENDTILILKKKIIEDFKLVVKYIDLNFTIDRPIRSLGKFNLDIGMMPRTFDNYTLDRWELSNRDLKCTFEEVEGHDPSIRKSFIKKANIGAYIPPSRANEIKTGDEYVREEANYTLDSNEDFPAL